MPDPTIHIFDNDSEADNCRKDVLTKSYTSDWKDDQILEQQTFTDGKIMVIERRENPNFCPLLRPGQKKY